MTERSVKRFVLAAAIVAVALLTGLAVAGLVVTSRGPDAQALPLMRTLIAQTTVGDTTSTVGAPGFAGPSDDQPPRAWPSELGTTTTQTLIVAALEGDTGTGGGKSGTTRRASPGTQAVDSGTPGPTRATIPSTTAKASGLAPPSSWGDPSPPPNSTTTTMPEEPESDETEDDQDREVVPPHIRESDHDEG